VDAEGVGRDGRGRWVQASTPAAAAAWRGPPGAVRLLGFGPAAQCRALFERAVQSSSFHPMLCYLQIVICYLI